MADEEGILLQKLRGRFPEISEVVFGDTGSKIDCSLSANCRAQKVSVAGLILVVVSTKTWFSVVHQTLAKKPSSPAAYMICLVIIPFLSLQIDEH